MPRADAHRDATAGLLPIHLAVFLFGFAGLFAKWLPLPPSVIVLGRTAFAGLALGVWLWRHPPADPARCGRDRLVFGLLGIVLAVHWVTFFHAIRVSTVAVGLLAFSTFPVFITFMEPILFKEPLRRFDLLTAALVTIGLVLVIPRFDTNDRILQGAAWGTLSGFTFAVLALLNRRYVQSTSPW
jgi:drug/metabolite transporter (DMT)-like permease